MFGAEVARHVKNRLLFFAECEIHALPLMSFGLVGRAGKSPPRKGQSIALKFRLAPSLMPENQRAVTVLVLV